MNIPEAIFLPVWAGYRSGLGEGMKGEVRTYAHGNRLTARQVAALEATIQRAETMKPKLIAAVLEAYPKLPKEHPHPKKMTEALLHKHLDLWQVILTTEQLDDVAYVGYCFECSWHDGGVAILTHGDRVISVGSFIPSDERDPTVLSYPHKDPVRDARKLKIPTDSQIAAAIKAAEKRALKNPTELPAHADDDVYVTLPVWAGYAAGPGEKASTGEIGMTIVDGHTTKEQQAAYRWLLKNPAKVQKRIHAMLIENWPKLHKYKGLGWPKVLERKWLEQLIALTGLTIHRENAEGVAYIGYEFRCRWDGEHGLGLITHKERVFDIGQAEFAYQPYRAERDRKRLAKEEKSSRRRV